MGHRKLYKRISGLFFVMKNLECRQSYRKQKEDKKSWFLLLFTLNWHYEGFQLL